MHCMVEVAGGAVATRLMDTAARRESTAVSAGGFGSTRLVISPRIPPCAVQLVASLGATTNAPSEQRATAFAGGAKRLDSSTGRAESAGALGRFIFGATTADGNGCGAARTKEGPFAGSGAVGGLNIGVVFCAIGIGIGAGGDCCARALSMTSATMNRAPAGRDNNAQHTLQILRLIMVSP